MQTEKSFKIPNVQSEAANQERTDNTIAKIQKTKEGFEDTKGVIRSTKGQTTIYKTRKTKD